MSAAALDRRPTLLSLRALGLGDLLTAVPALRALRAAFPSHRHLLATPPWLEPLVLALGAVDEVVPLAGLEEVLELASPEVAVNLHGAGPESHRLLLRLRPRRLIAFENDQVPESRGGPRFDAGEHEVQRWCRLLREERLEADPRNLALQLPGPLPDLEGATLIHPGAKSAARRWPAERWAQVARHERERGRRVIVTGGRGEEEIVQELAGLGGVLPRDVHAGDLGLLDLGRHVAGAGRVASGDTGVAHLATAVGTPSVTLFGPTSPEIWGPPIELRDRHRVLWAGTTGDPGAAAPDPGLLRITPEHVIQELDRLP